MPPAATAVEIRDLGPDGTAAELDGFLELHRLLDDELSPGDPPIGPAELAGELHPGDDALRAGHFVAWLGDRAVGVADTERHLRGGALNVVEVSVAVDPAFRRAGVGTALLKAALDREATAEVDSVLGWGILSAATSGFYAGLGCPQSYLERESRLVLDEVDPDLMEAWIARASERAGEYTLVQWTDRCPDDLLDGFAVARTALNDAPRDDLSLPDYGWTPELVRLNEQRWVDRAMRSLVFAAVHTPTGEVGGYTLVAVAPERPQMLFQGDTGVLAAHRNRGLGRWLKASMWQRLRRDFGQARTIDTQNAESNAAMLAINVEMGFRPHLTYAAWQAPLKIVTARLAAQAPDPGLSLPTR